MNDQYFDNLSLGKQCVYFVQFLLGGIAILILFVWLYDIVVMIPGGLLLGTIFGPQDMAIAYWGLLLPVPAAILCGIAYLIGKDTFGPALVESNRAVHNK